MYGNSRKKYIWKFYTLTMLNVHFFNEYYDTDHIASENVI